MDWSLLDDDPQRTRLARALVDRVPATGWSRAALTGVCAEALGDGAAWRVLFPTGSSDAIWWISRVSDASMLAAFAARPAANLSAVIDERFAQNHDLKSFVRKVMVFDMLHPVQALARMHRTAMVMIQCMGRAPAGLGKLTRLNLAYTLIVFIWLMDRSTGGRCTRGGTRALMRLIGEA